MLDAAMRGPVERFANHPQPVAVTGHRRLQRVDGLVIERCEIERPDREPFEGPERRPPRGRRAQRCRHRRDDLARVRRTIRRYPAEQHQFYS